MSDVGLEFLVLERLEAIWRPAVTPVVVYLGPSVAAQTEAAALWIAADAFDQAGTARTVRTEQTYPNLGARTKQTVVTVTNSLAAWSGDPEAAGRIRQVARILGQLEQAARADLTIGLPPTIPVISSNVSDFSVAPALTDQGNAVIATFTFTLTARI